MTPREMELLSAYHDGQTNAEETAQIERLLSNDPSARLLLDDMRRTSRLVGGLPRQNAPEDMHQRIVARAEREALLGSGGRAAARGRSLYSSMVRWTSIAAAMGLIVVGWMIYKPPMEEARHASISVADNEEKTSQKVASAEGRLEPMAAPTAAAPPMVGRGQIRPMDVARAGGVKRETAMMSKSAPASSMAPRDVELSFKRGEPGEVRARIDQYIASTGSARIADDESGDTGIVLPGLDWIVPGLPTTTAIAGGDDMVVYVARTKLMEFVRSVSDLEEELNFDSRVRAGTDGEGGAKVADAPAKEREAGSSPSGEVRVRIHFLNRASSSVLRAASQPTGAPR